MRGEAGVYALIMPLKKERTMTIDRKGTQVTFPQGWYVYVGSAHGPGGLKSRTDRHLKNRSKSKRMHWNVDYFREFAPISEIWFSHAPSAREHDWAWATMRMHGATIPVEGFGASDCFPRCQAHFFHFPRRPFPAEFRSDLVSRQPFHPQIYVEFVEPVTSDLLSLHSPVMPTLVQYDRGRRLLEMRRRAPYDGLVSGATAVNSLRFRDGTFERCLVRQLASAFGMSESKLIEATKFAHAVDDLCLSCNEDVFAAIFSPTRPQTPKAVMQLARTSDVRQCHRITGVLEGRFRSVAPQSGDAVYDTVGFQEVPSRLARARGSLNNLEDLLGNNIDADVASEICRLTKLCLAAAKRLQKFISLEVVTDRDVPKKLSKSKVWPILASREVCGELVGMARQALRLTIKNVWDYPEMQRREICGKPAERETAQRELEKILSTSKAVLEFLDESVKESLA